MHAAAADSGFFQGLAARRFLQAFARLDKAREARPHPRRKMALPAHQTIVADAPA